MKCEVPVRGIRRYQIFERDGKIFIRGFKSAFTPEEWQNLLAGKFGLFGRKFTEMFEANEFQQHDAANECAHDLIGRIQDSSSPIEITSVFSKISRVSLADEL